LLSGYGIDIEIENEVFMAMQPITPIADVDGFDMGGAESSPMVPSNLASHTNVRENNRSQSGGTSNAREATNSPELASILIVDDEPINSKVVRKYLLDAGYSRITACSEATHALAIIAREIPNLILLDIEMPGMSGLAILEVLRADDRFERLPVIILTAVDDRDVKNRALELGATDFLQKPVNVADLIPRVHNVLMAKAYEERLCDYTMQLEEEVRKRTLELEESRLQIIHCLARAAEYRDNETGHHILRVGLYSGVIARGLGLDAKTVTMIQQAAPLHDVGKIGIPDSILLKPGKLTPEEYDVIRKHAGFGNRILKQMKGDEFEVLTSHTSLGAKIMDGCQASVIRMATVISLTHHEKWDGSGYPLGLAGEDIAIEGRIVAVADVFDALSSKRPYKPPFSIDKCFGILEEGRGKHFDSRVLDAFFARREEIVQIQLQYADVED